MSTFPLTTRIVLGTLLTLQLWTPNTAHNPNAIVVTGSCCSHHTCQRTFSIWVCKSKFMAESPNWQSLSHTLMSLMQGRLGKWSNGIFCLLCGNSTLGSMKSNFLKHKKGIQILGSKKEWLIMGMTTVKLLKSQYPSFPICKMKIILVPSSKYYL